MGLKAPRGQISDLSDFPRFCGRMSEYLRIYPVKWGYVRFGLVCVDSPCKMAELPGLLAYARLCSFTSGSCSIAQIWVILS